MNKEEQIKRLAQNLFKNGFTKSMDYAVQTAANMLGFPDSLVTNELMKKEDSKYGAESLLNGGIDYSKSRHDIGLGRDNPTESHDPQNYTGSDFTRRISRSMAEERVFSQIPSPFRPPMSSESKDDEKVFIDYSSSDENVDQAQAETPRDADPVHDISRGDESMEKAEDEASFLEDSSFFSELREEEQTSLISGYVSSSKEDFFKDDISSDGVRQEDTVRHVEKEPQEHENIFKVDSYENMDRRGSDMDSDMERAAIRSRFPVEFDNDEDFFTPVLKDDGKDDQRHTYGPQAEAQDEDWMTQSQGAGASGPARTDNVSHGQSREAPAEAQVDITKMFDFRNMNG